MKRIFLTIYFIFIGMVIISHAQSEFLIFNSTGHVLLFKSDRMIDKLQGETYNYGDLLIVTDGSVTLINRDNKRVTINESGEYKYDDMFSLFDQAQSSLTNKYFVYVWEKMNSGDAEVNKPGGVIRGDEFGFQPPNKVVVLSDSIGFQIPNMSGNKFDIRVLSDSKDVLYEGVIIDKLVLSVSDLCNHIPGKYTWEVSTSFGGKPDRMKYYIPEENEREVAVDKYLKAIESFSEFDDDIAWILTREYMIDNNNYYYAK